MSVEYWIKYDAGGALRLPVNPQAISVGSPFGFVDVDVTHLGEYTVFGERGQRTFSFSSFFPAEYNPSYCEYSGFPSPQEIVQMLEGWRDKKKPLRLVVTGTPINYPVTLRNFSCEYEKAGAMGDIYYTLEFKEYRDQEYREAVDISAVPTASEVKAAQRPPIVNKPETNGAKEYTVKSGDSLSKVFGAKWRDVYEANKATIGANPNVIKPGQKLVVPS